jgi:hypothetical protein
MPDIHIYRKSSDIARIKITVGFQSTIFFSFLCQIQHKKICCLLRNLVDKKEELLYYYSCYHRILAVPSKPTFRVLVATLIQVIETDKEINIVSDT